VCAGLLTACHKKEDKPNLQDAIVGSWKVADIQLSAGIAKISLYQLVPTDNIPLFKFTKEKTFDVYDQSGLSYITGTYQATKNELTLNIAVAENSIKMSVEVNSKDKITVTQNFQTDFLALLQDAQLQTSLRLALSSLGSSKDATVILELHRQ
jgi:hypothetical protein